MDISIRDIADKLKDYDNFCIVYHIEQTCREYLESQTKTQHSD